LFLLQTIVIIKEGRAKKWDRCDIRITVDTVGADSEYDRRQFGNVSDIQKLPWATTL
jgi:hypothetical protein